MQHPDNRPAHVDVGAFKLDDYDLARVRAELDRLPAVDEQRLCSDPRRRVADGNLKEPGHTSWPGPHHAEGLSTAVAHVIVVSHGIVDVRRGSSSIRQQAESPRTGRGDSRIIAVPQTLRQSRNGGRVPESRQRPGCPQGKCGFAQMCCNHCRWRLAWIWRS